jgi:hypothetical protein
MIDGAANEKSRSKNGKGTTSVVPLLPPTIRGFQPPR